MPTRNMNRMTPIWLKSCSAPREAGGKRKASTRGASQPKQRRPEQDPGEHFPDDRRLAHPGEENAQPPSRSNNDDHLKEQKSQGFRSS